MGGINNMDKIDIDKLKEYYKKQKDYDMQFKHELLEQIRCLNLDNDEKDAKIEKKDKMIDLMAEQLIGLLVNKIKQDFEKPNFKAEITIFTDKEDIKQYFERKAINDG